MSNKNNIKRACTFISLIMGAGFASGQEISLYFASTNILVPLSAAVICGFMCFVFAEAGRITEGELLNCWFKKVNLPVEIAIRTANGIILCAMLAGTELVIKNLFGINGGSFYSAVLVLIMLYFGEEKIKLLNTLILPVIFALILIILIKSNPPFPSFKEIRIFSPFVYAAMNILSAGFLMSSMSRGTTFKDSIISSVITTIILAIFMGMIYTVIQFTFDKTMPVLYAATLVGMGQIASIMLYLCIFTTMTGCLLVASNRKFPTAIAITAIALVVSLLGFKKIVTISYPIIGYMGISLCGYTVFRLLFRFYKLKQEKNSGKISLK